MAVDDFSNVYYSDESTSTVRMVDISTTLLSTVAGSKTLGAGYSGDGGLATDAQLDNPTSLAFDSGNNLYIVDQGNEAIRKVESSSGIITTFFDINAVNPSTDARRRLAFVFKSASYHMATDTQDNVYISDANACIIILVSSDPTYNNNTGYGILAGTYGSCGFSGDGSSVYGPAVSGILFNKPLGLAYFEKDNSLIVVDNGNSRVRSIALDSGIVTTIIGNGNIGYTGDGGVATSASLANPVTVTISLDSRIFVTDRNNSVIRVLNTTSNVIFSYAGIGTPGYNGNNLLIKNTELNYPYIIVAGNTPDTFFIADTGNNRIRYVTLTNIAPTSAPTSALLVGVSSADNQLVSSNFIAIWTAVAFVGFAMITFCCFYYCFAAAALAFKVDDLKVDWYRLEIDPMSIIPKSSDSESDSVFDGISPFVLKSEDSSMLGISNSQVLTNDDIIQVDYPSLYAFRSHQSWNSETENIVDKFATSRRSMTAHTIRGVNVSIDLDDDSDFDFEIEEDEEEDSPRMMNYSEAHDRGEV